MTTIMAYMMQCSTRNILIRRSAEIFQRRFKKKYKPEASYEGKCENDAYIALHEPPGLDDKPDIEEYGPLQIRISAYDFPLVEAFAGHTHRLIKQFGMTANGFAIPAETTHVKSLQHRSELVEHEYHVSRYQRVIEFDSLPSTLAPILFDTLQKNLPQGVDFTVKEPTPEDDEFRYIPDIMLEQMQAELDDLERRPSTTSST